MLNCVDSVLLSGLPFDSSRGVFDRQDSFRSDYLSDRDSRYGIVQQASIDSTDSRLCYLTSSEVSGDEGKGREEDDCTYSQCVPVCTLKLLHKLGQPLPVHRPISVAHSSVDANFCLINWRKLHLFE